jgi:hypothetical protein
MVVWNSFRIGATKVLLPIGFRQSVQCDLGSGASTELYLPEHQCHVSPRLLVYMADNDI